LIFSIRFLKDNFISKFKDCKRGIKSLFLPADKQIRDLTVQTDKFAPFNFTAGVLKILIRNADGMGSSKVLINAAPTI
jgi:hypothetical protein